MFRSLFQRTRSVRVPSEHGSIDLQTVKVTRRSKARPIVARFILMSVTTVVTLETIKYLDPFGSHGKIAKESDSNDRAEDRISQYGKHWEAQHARTDPPRPLPGASSKRHPDMYQLTIPIWIRKGPIRLYSPNDPEYKEFIKLQSDPTRMNKIKTSIVKSCLDNVKRFNLENASLGTIRFNGKVVFQLDIIPPLAVPGLYEVPCMWVSSRAVEFDWRALPPDTAVRVERIFRPLVLLEAASVAGRIWLTMTYNITKARVNELLGNDTSASKRGGKPRIVMPQITETSASDTQDPSSSDAAKSTKPMFPFLPGMDGTSTKKMHQDIVSAMPYSLAITHAAWHFNMVKDQRQRARVPKNTRGVCQVQGTLYMLGDRGKFKMDIIAHYLPAEDVFLGGIEVKERYLVMDYNAWQKEKDKALEQRESDARKRTEAVRSLKERPVPTSEKPAEGDEPSSGKEVDK